MFLPDKLSPGIYRYVNSSNVYSLCHFSLPFSCYILKADREEKIRSKEFSVFIIKTEGLVQQFEAQIGEGSQCERRMSCIIERLQIIHLGL